MAAIVKILRFFTGLLSQKAAAFVMSSETSVQYTALSKTQSLTGTFCDALSVQLVPTRIVQVLVCSKWLSSMFSNVEQGTPIAIGPRKASTMS